jgi:hypothetical protein
MVAVMQPGNRIAVFGAAGTGKSWLVRQYTATIPRSTSYVVIGITALSVKHYPNSSTYEMYMLDRETVHDIVIVEEIGLLSAVQYDVLSQRVGDNTLICCGDVVQLSNGRDRFFTSRRWVDDFADAKVFNTQSGENALRKFNVYYDYETETVRPVVIVLRKYQRTKGDVEYTQILRRLRRCIVSGERDYNVINFICTVLKNKPGRPDATHLYHTRKEVEDHGCAISPGQYMMITKNQYNDDQTLRVRNGDIMMLTGINQDGEYEFENGIVSQHVQPADALTIHKSQGQTMDAIVVHTDKIYSAVMLYVALSRAKGSDGVCVRGPFVLDVLSRGVDPGTKAFIAKYKLE